MKVLKHQLWHLLILLLMLYVVYYLVHYDTTYLQGSLGGLNTTNWIILSLLSPILHQVYVVVCWRLELYYQTISSTLGRRGFKMFKLGFALLILSRPLTITLLAVANQGSLGLNQALGNGLALVFFLPAAYLFYSIAKYFPIDQAFGVDHFQPEKYQDTTFVKKGIFKYTSNGMYIYGFLILWIPGLLMLSKAALLLAFFNHVYIWVHYYFTELPDIKVIYGRK